MVLYRLKNTLQTSEDVEKKLHRPLLAALPILPRRKNKNRGQPSWISLIDLYAESIRVVSTEVLLSALNTPRMIVSRHVVRARGGKV